MRKFVVTDSQGNKRTISAEFVATSGDFAILYVSDRSYSARFTVAMFYKPVSVIEEVQ